MPLEKSLTASLIISVIFHTAIFLPLINAKKPAPEKKSPRLEITYFAPAEIKLKKNRRDNTNNAPLKAAKQQLPLNATTVKVKEEVPAKKDETQQAEEQKIEIPPELPKEKEKMYLDYYQSIRNKIRRLAVQNYSHYVDRGEICLYFVLQSNGKLKQVTIIEERSSPNRSLRKTAKRSLLQASPFAPFPRELDLPQLSFNVIISFELEN